MRTVTAAISRLLNESFRERVTLKSSYSGTGLPATQVMPASSEIHLRATLESRRRLKALETIPAVGAKVRVILYDGAAYVAVSGSRYRRLTGAAGAGGADPLGAAFSLFTQGSAPSIVGVRALGVTSIAGQPTDHYAGTDSPAALRSLLSRFTRRLGVHGNPDAIHLTASRVDVFLSRTTGQIVRETSVNDITVDLSNLAIGGAPGPHGTLKLHQESTSDVYDAGSKLTVHIPQTAAAVVA